MSWHESIFVSRMVIIMSINISITNVKTKVNFVNSACSLASSHVDIINNRKIAACGNAVRKFAKIDLVLDRIDYTQCSARSDAKFNSKLAKKVKDFLKKNAPKPKYELIRIFMRRERYHVCSALQQSTVQFKI